MKTKSVGLSVIALILFAIIVVLAFQIPIVGITSAKGMLMTLGIAVLAAGLKIIIMLKFLK